MRRVLVVMAAALVTASAACTTERDRASGITERWLQAVSDLGRDNLRDDATERAAEHADLELVDAVLLPPKQQPDEKRYFADFEVGAAVDGKSDAARVPFRLSARTAADDTTELTGTAVLRPTDHSWRIVAIDERGDGELVPSEGGDRPARATGGQWLVALIVGLSVLLASTLLIKRQPDPRAAAGPA